MDDYIRMRSGLLVPQAPRVLQRYCKLLGFGALLFTAGAGGIPANVVSQTTTTQTLIVQAACTLDAKLWGSGGGNHSSGGLGAAGGYARATFPLQPGDVLTYASGAPGIGSTAGVSGSRQGNGGAGSGSSGGGGARTELYINGVLRLVAGAGAGASGSDNPGAGGGTEGQKGTDFLGGAGLGGTQTAPGAGGNSNGNFGSAGSGGNGGAGGSGGGGGGGGYFGGGGGAAYPGGGGSGYDSTGAGTLTTGNYSTPANSNDPDRINDAGAPQQPGLCVLRFAA